AERHSATGLIIYSDPQDDGYFRGDIYPRGPMRPWGGIQRGSVLNVNGDPTTPGYPSLPGARRVPEESLPIPRIPVLPMSYGNAQRLLERLGGPSVPQAWQGALAFRYHVGPGPVRARLRVRTERGARAMHPIWDTFGMVRGARYPDEWIIVGAHRDAWGPRCSGDASPSAKPVSREAAKAVPDPRGPGTVYEVWLRRNKGDTTDLTLGNLGGGSDFAGFYHHLGIPAGGIGFDAPNGIYHSMYDSYDWMSRFGDPGYRSHGAGAQLVAVMAARLATAESLPYSYVALGPHLIQLVSQLDSGLARQQWTVSTQGLKDALGRFT